MLVKRCKCWSKGVHAGQKVSLWVKRCECWSMLATSATGNTSAQMAGAAACLHRQPSAASVGQNRRMRNTREHLMSPSTLQHRRRTPSAAHQSPASRRQRLEKDSSASPHLSDLAESLPSYRGASVPRLIPWYHGRAPRRRKLHAVTAVIATQGSRRCSSCCCRSIRSSSSGSRSHARVSDRLGSSKKRTRNKRTTSTDTHHIHRHTPQTQNQPSPVPARTPPPPPRAPTSCESASLFTTGRQAWGGGGARAPEPGRGLRRPTGPPRRAAPCPRAAPATRRRPSTQTTPCPPCRT
jgi:hypothetical protein